MKRIAATLALMLLASTATAALPSSEEVKKVMDFYRQGQGQGVVMPEIMLCDDVVREGEKKNECANDIQASGAARGQSVYLWMSFMVPEGDDARIVVEFEEGGTVHYKKDFTVSGSLRYRAWRTMRFPRTGEWTAKVYQDRGEQRTALGSYSIKVVEAAPEPAPQAAPESAPEPAPAAAN